MRPMLAILAAFALGLCGCTTTYEPQEIGRTGRAAIFDDSYLAQIAEGRTTRDDVRGLLGLPTDVAFGSDGTEIWTYEASVTRSRTATVGMWSSSGGGTDSDIRRFIVLFDQRGVVKRAALAGTHTSSGPALP